MIQSAAPQVTLKNRLVFWLMLGSISVILAEVTCFSTPFPFFTGWGLLVTTPLYMLHTLALSILIFRRKQVTLPVLFLAGLVFGLYEAYITKVLWNPTWGDTKWMLGGVSVVQTSVLILFWHPWMAFILPVALGETLFTASNEIKSALPCWLQHSLYNRKGRILVLIGFGMYCGAYQSMNATSLITALLSSLSSAVVFFGLAFGWDRLSGGKRYTFRQMLPSDRLAMGVMSLLAVFYLVSIFAIRPEAMPHTIGPHMIIWMLYLAAFGLIFLNLRRTPDWIEPPAIEKRMIPWGMLAGFWLIFVFSSMLFSAMRNVAYVFVILSWVVGVVYGLGIIMKSTARLFRKTDGKRSI